MAWRNLTGVEVVGDTAEAIIVSPRLLATKVPSIYCSAANLSPVSSTITRNRRTEHSCSPGKNCFALLLPVTRSSGYELLKTLVEEYGLNPYEYKLELL